MNENFKSIDEIFVSFKSSVLKTIFPHNYTFQSSFSKVVVENGNIVLANQDLCFSNGAKVATLEDIKKWNRDFLKVAKKENYSTSEIKKWTLSEKQISLIEKLFKKCQEKINLFNQNALQPKPEHTLKENPIANQSINTSAAFTSSPPFDQPMIQESKSESNSNSNNISSESSPSTVSSFFEIKKEEKKDPNTVPEKEKFLKLLFVSDDHYDKTIPDQDLINQYGFIPAADKNIKEIIDFIKPEVVFHNGDIVDFDLYTQLQNNKNFKFHYVYGEADLWINSTKLKISKSAATNISIGQIYQIIQLHGDDFVNKDYVTESIQALTMSKVKEKILDPNNLAPDIITFGHSHQQLIENRQNVLHINPGSINYENWLESIPKVGSFVVVYLSASNKNKCYLEKYEIILVDNKRTIKLSETIQNCLNK